MVTNFCMFNPKWLQRMNENSDIIIITNYHVIKYLKSLILSGATQYKANKKPNAFKSFKPFTGNKDLLLEYIAKKLNKIDGPLYSATNKANFVLDFSPIYKELNGNVSKLIDKFEPPYGTDNAAENKPNIKYSNKNISYSSLLDRINKSKNVTKELIKKEMERTPSNNFLEPIYEKLKEMALIGHANQKGFDQHSGMGTTWAQNFKLLENRNPSYKEYSKDFQLQKDSSLNSKKIKNGKIVKAIAFIKTDKLKVNLKGINKEFTHSGKIKNFTLKDLLNLQKIPEKYDKVYWNIKLAPEGNLSEEEKAAFKSVFKLEIKKDGKFLFKDYSPAGLSSIGNLNAAHTLAGSAEIKKYQSLKNTSNWYYLHSNRSNANISEVIYAMYRGRDFTQSAIAGAKEQTTPSFDRWTDITGSQLQVGTQNTKSKLGLEADLNFDINNAKNGLTTSGNKLKVATVIAYRNYNSYGIVFTSTMSSNETIVPSNTGQHKFADGRIKSVQRRIKDSSITASTPNNYAVSAIINSGPDFMSNLFDMTIFTYKLTRVGASANKPRIDEKLISFVIGPNINKENYESYKNSGIIKGVSKSTSHTLSKSKDFLTRVSSITIPSFLGSSVDTKFLTSTIKSAAPMLDTDGSSTFVLEHDSDLEYMRLFNRLAGLSLYERQVGVSDRFPLTRGANPVGNFAPNRGNGGKLSQHSGYFGIVVKLHPQNLQYYKGEKEPEPAGKERYIVFEAVKFLGGGEASFKAGNPSLATFTQKFVYKNVNICSFSLSNTDSQGNESTNTPGMKLYLDPATVYNTAFHQTRY